MHDMDIVLENGRKEKVESKLILFFCLICA